MGGRAGHPKVYIVIPNWNGLRFLEDCLGSVSGQTYPNYGTILVDNGSTDGSVEFVRSNYPHVIVIANEVNVGFAEGSNIGIRAALQDPATKYVAMLNNDTRVVAGWLAELVQTAEEGAVDMVASKVLFFSGRELNSAGLVPHRNGLASCIGFMGPPDKYEAVMEVFGSPASAGLYSRKMLEDIETDGDYFDSDFFAFGEDVDIAFRARWLGYRCLFSPGAVVYHHWSGTSGRLSALAVFYAIRNSYYTIVKNYPSVLRCIPEVVLLQVAAAAYSLAGAKYTIRDIIRANAAALAGFGGMLRKRGHIRGRRRVPRKEIAGWVTPYPFAAKIREKWTR